MARRSGKSPVTSLPVPSSARVMVFVGGTFDPPHAAHVDLPRDVRDRCFGGDDDAWLLYVPAARSPFKDARASAGDRERIDMLRLALRGVPRSAIWTDEIDRARSAAPSYWIDTLSRAAEVAPKEAEFKFIIGSDQAALFHKWKDFRRILDIAQPIVLVREPHRDAAGVVRAMKKTGEWTASELESWRSWIIDTRVMEVSSTLIREALAAGDDSRVAGDDARLKGLVNPSVLSYIRKHGLYSAARPNRAQGR